MRSSDSATGLSLILLLRLVSTSPIPIVLPDCTSDACTAFISNPHTPPPSVPITQSEVHFPPHQRVTISSTIDNSVLTPPKDVPPAKALSAAQPLSSAYLMGLEAANPSTKKAQSDPVQEQEPEDESVPLPAKPTSALPELRKEDSRRYWASVAGGDNGDEGPKQNKHACTSGAGATFLHRTTAVRHYSDCLVVGIVLAFLATIVCLEAVEKMEGLKNWFSGRQAICLEDGEESCVGKTQTSFHLQPAPATRPKEKSALITLVEVTEEAELDGEIQNEKI